MYTAAIAETGYRNLPLSMLDESATNPRRTFEPAKLVELAHSLTMHGLQSQARASMGAVRYAHCAHAG